ncbi:MAG TPA: tRNA-binding protein [Actinomycetota bacterium]|nr:tRNA-binding protein [Actinomycetota bacterium]
MSDVPTPHSIDPESRPYEPSELPRKDDVGAAAFFTVDMRAGRVVEVDDFPEARKPAWKLAVDFGPVVGMLRTSAQVKNYTRDELLGRMVVGALNLGRKKIAGFTSEFLILGALDPDGTVRLLGLEDGVEPGAPIA